jgi:hypothetical protein
MMGSMTVPQQKPRGGLILHIVLLDAMKLMVVLGLA